jgi:hypothetical protein
MKTADDIVQALGGTKAVADALNLTPSVVSSWRSSNSIPRWRHDELITLSDGRLSPTDLPVKRRQQAAA